jgi:NADH-quinone oxidoreductase subunit L
MNRIGDVGILLGTFTIFKFFCSIEFYVVFSLAPIFASKTIDILTYKLDLITLISLCLFIGSIGKSAQIGLHT